MSAAVGLLVLAAVLGFAVAPPRGLPEAVPGAGLLVALGWSPGHRCAANWWRVGRRWGS
ncbi:hypothetical protein [Micromonospora sp. NPDC000668]|uniref:hypothetical protein n=1 Tax=Micromonospora sp. NPDC000668 TaxID=3364219 RepID=UPI00367FB1B3